MERAAVKTLMELAGWTATGKLQRRGHSSYQPFRKKGKARAWLGLRFLETESNDIACDFVTAVPSDIFKFLSEPQDLLMKKNHTRTSPKTQKPLKSKRGAKSNIPRAVYEKLWDEKEHFRARLAEEKSRVARGSAAVLTKLMRERDQWRERAGGYKEQRDSLKMQFNSQAQAIETYSDRNKELFQKLLDRDDEIEKLTITKRPFAVSCQISKHGNGIVSQSITQSVKLATSEDEAIGMAVKFALKEKPNFGIEQILVSDINAALAAQQQSEKTPEK